MRLTRGIWSRLDGCALGALGAGSFSLQQSSWCLLPDALVGLRRGEYCAMARQRPTREKPHSCEACGEPCSTGKLLVYDHEHRTERFRGWLCMGCNVALGFCKDNPDRLRLLAVYQEKFLADSLQKASKSTPKDLSYSKPMVYTPPLGRVLGHVAKIDLLSVRIVRNDTGEELVFSGRFLPMVRVGDKCDFIIRKGHDVMLACLVRWVYTKEEARERLTSYYISEHAASFVNDPKMRIKIIEPNSGVFEYRKYLTAC